VNIDEMLCTVESSFTKLNAKLQLVTDDCLPFSFHFQCFLVSFEESVTECKYWNVLSFLTKNETTKNPKHLSLPEYFTTRY